MKDDICTSNNDQCYSVLMSVYIKEHPEYFKLAIQSMIHQTVQPKDFVIVCDGPLTVELNGVISEFVSIYPEMFQILRLEQNQGLGNALNEGLKLCRYDLVARMDSDDISLPNRCEYQIEMFQQTPNLALCSGDIAEFDSNPEEIKGIRQVPKTHEEILKYAKKRNPMNHVAVMYRKAAVMDAGGYIEINLAEDYYLWIRMLKKGYIAANVSRILVKVRVGNGMYVRRGGLDYVKSIYSLQKMFLALHFITYPEFIRNCTERILCGLMPSGIRQWIYQKCLRKKMKV